MSSTIAKSLSRLSRDRLVNLCIVWSKSSKCDPYLTSNRNILETEEEDYLHEPAESRGQLRETYQQFRNGDVDFQSLSKRDIIDRILDGDWRRGLSYDQLASVDFACLEDNDTSLRWTALELVPLTTDKDGTQQQRPAKRRKLEHSDNGLKSPRYPDTTATIFVQNLKAHISPLVKAHYHIHRLVHLRLSVVRLYILPNSPFAPLSANIPRHRRSATDLARVVFIALPDSCPYVYVSVSGSGGPHKRDKKDKQALMRKIDMAATKKLILEAVPKALSRPQQRWSLQTTKLTARSLQAMSLLRGSGKVGATGGSLTDLVRIRGETANERISDDASKAEDVTIVTKLRSSTELELEVERRFGNMEGSGHAKLDRAQLKIHDVLCSHHTKTKKRKLIDDADRDPANITITMSGSDVFAGLKQFALQHPQYLDMSKLPATLTGEDANTNLVV